MRGPRAPLPMKDARELAVPLPPLRWPLATRAAMLSLAEAVSRGSKEGESRQRAASWVFRSVSIFSSASCFVPSEAHILERVSPTSSRSHSAVRTCWLTEIKSAAHPRCCTSACVVVWSLEDPTVGGREGRAEW